MNNSKKQILIYIQNEKDISRYQISVFEKIKNISPAKRRLLSIEKEFINLPLESMNFEDVADVAAAISIYKTSRSIFYKTYHIEPPTLKSLNKNKVLNILVDKIEFVKKIAISQMTTKIQELNLIQNSDFYYDLVKRQSLKNNSSIEIEKRQLDLLNLEQLLIIEPLTLAKKRARVQAAIFSIGKHLLDSISKININESQSIEMLLDVEKRIDTIIYELKFNVFKNYNQALKILPTWLDKTMGKNLYITKIHELQNILNFTNIKKTGIFPSPISNPSGFSNKLPMLGNIFFGSKKAISTTLIKDSEKNIQNKVYGILLPIPRKGNEKMTLLHKDIKIDGLNVSHLFCDNFSNVRANRGNKQTYFKGILLKPLWQVIGLANTDSSSRLLLSKIASFQEADFSEINFDDKKIVNKINNQHSGFFNLDANSIVLAAKTRSEEEGLNEIFSIISAKILEITEDYNKIESTTNHLVD